MPVVDKFGNLDKAYFRNIRPWNEFTHPSVVPAVDIGGFVDSLKSGQRESGKPS